MTTITGTNYRISFLTSRLIRLEYQPEGAFEDQRTVFARRRTFPDVPVRQTQSKAGLELTTEHLHLTYDEKAFCAGGLSVSVKGFGTWHYGEPIETLGGTARTLDRADGEIPVGPGVISRAGFSVIDDSNSVLLTEAGGFLPREHKETDIYFFGYGHAYQECLKDYYALTGSVPMLPRFALGNWWSRYHEYTEETYLRLMERFEAAGIPLSAAVIDMDWHITRNPWTSGWTGYTWNKELFPDPERFLRALHEKGLHTTLNLHPATGIAPHEEAYERFCRLLGEDPKQQRIIPFDPANERFWEGYFELLHHPMEEQGVDFWWIDWQQGTKSTMEGLDPLWILNEKHYRDIQRNGKRGLILSRYAGPGSHRCPVGFSGDTVTSWKSLEFQPRFTSMASNIGYPWWSHDIGGHMHGIRNDELAVRWLQLGVFSPILRLHSSKSEFMSKEPWAFGREAEEIMTQWLRFRHRLVPYLYTAGERTHRMGEALVRPMYYAYPEREEAYQHPNQYLFGQSLMVCPITSPRDPVLAMGCTQAWLPEGLWFDFFSGQIYDGGRTLTLWRDLQSYPVFAPAGAIIPLSDDPCADKNPASLTLRVFSGASNEYEMFEDDGISPDSQSARTRIRLDWEEKILNIRAEGDLTQVPEERRWNVELIGITNVPVYLNGIPAETTYDEKRNALCFSLRTAGPGPVSVSFPEAEIATDDRLLRTKTRLHAAQSSLDEKERIWPVLREHLQEPSLEERLREVCETPGMFSLLSETLFTRDRS